jgi:hypothetical protein
MFNGADQIVQKQNDVLLASADDVLPAPTQNPTIVAAGKTRFFVFSPKISFPIHFLPKTPRKHFKDLNKPINGHQKPKKTTSKPEIHPKQKFFSSSDSLF